ncbi:MAG: ribose-phosphate pyrophosphokinase [Patescibacteria group bacterium]|nr:ribose-phosphate pyrophosphokinase [Patescibacteria group bacterium]
MKIFSGSSNKPLAERTAKELGIEVSPLEISVFPDGERRIRVVDKVVDEKVVVLQSTSTPPDQNYMELFFIIDALIRSGASEITAVVPYLGYERQDHIFRDGEAVSLEVIAQTLQRVGADKLVAFDLHSIKVPELFTIPVLHLSALDLFADKIREIVSRQSRFSNDVLSSSALRSSSRLDEFSDASTPASRWTSGLGARSPAATLMKTSSRGKTPRAFDTVVNHKPARNASASVAGGSSIINRQSFVLVSPDMGGIRRIKMLSESLDNMPYATIEKNRDLQTGDISDSSMEGDVSGKTAIIVDDMISTGRTIVAAEKILLKNGAKKIFVFATHAVFSENAKELLENLEAEKVFVTDTIFIPKDKHFSKLEIISVSKVIAEGLKNF